MQRRWALLPSEANGDTKASADAEILVVTRGIRAFVDGLVYVMLPGYLILLGFSGLQVGAVVTASLLGSAALTFAVGVRGHGVRRRQLLQIVSLLMIATGIAFSFATTFVVLVIIAAIGTMNPSAGDVSVFLPTEQAVLPATVSDRQRTSLFAMYNLIGALVGSIGAISTKFPLWLGDRLGLDELQSMRTTFWLYAVAGVAVFVLYRRLSPAIEHGADDPATALGPSRKTVYKLAALFSLDAFGGGFAVQSIFAIWVFHKFDLSTADLGIVFFATGVLSAFSSLIAVRIAKRIGLVRTMVFTHIPASVLLVAVVFMPNVWWAMSLFIFRGLLSQMDVPVRISYVMAVVTPRERPAAASITNVPRSLASALPPIFAGWMLDHSTFGWPLLICAALKITYDLILLLQFRHIRPPEEILL
ncbi:MAG: MFS transporter [Ilumatobacteraceae bacterium]